WADEAQVWQLCKYLSLPELFNHLHNEGHPAFFYLLVMPFAKMFSDIIYMQLICWAFMCVSVFLLFYFAPFKLYTKFAITLSAGFFYFLPVIARSYSILPALVFLAAILYSKQKEHPVLYALVLAAIANTHAIMFAFSFILFCLFIYDNFIKNQDKNFKKYILPVVIFVLGFCAVIWQLHDSVGSNYYMSFNFKDVFEKIPKLLFYFFVNGYNNVLTIKNLPRLSTLDISLISAMAVCYLYCFFYLFRNSKRFFFIASLSILFQFAIYVFAYGYNMLFVNRIFSAHIILLFCLWLSFVYNSGGNTFNLKESVINVLLFIFFILTAFNGFNYYKIDIMGNYSGAKETANFIQNNITPENSLFYIDNEPYCISVVYYLNKEGKTNYNLYSVIRNKNLKYVVWDEKSYYTFMTEAWSNYAEWQNEKPINKDKDIFVLRAKKNDSSSDLEKTQKHNFKKIFESSKTIDPYEGYNLYQYTGQVLIQNQHCD
ncbi:MAG: hypothetical protein LUG16_07150, partial [Candidatus Gastranaerophilales bacterium]|nr:hypothetical protein [Candidatus Gastranaerophilales bacterium]